MEDKVYNDPEIGTVRLVKNAASRRISIRVHPEDGVRVLIPRSLPYRMGLGFFISRRDWVIAAMERQKKKIADAEKRGRALALLRDGATVRTLLSEIVFRRDGSAGNASVNVETSRVEDIVETGRTYLSIERPVFRKTLVYTGDLPPDGSAELDVLLRKVLVEVLRTEAKLVLPRRLELLASRYGFGYGRMTVKHNSSNWGSCSARGNINLNLNLVRLPEPLCDCVILHELCHLRHLDHGPGFHALMERLCADNLKHLSAGGDPYVREILSKIRRSRAAMPVHSTLEREMKTFRLI